MGEPWASAAALAAGAFAGAMLVGWFARSAVHAGYMALVLVVLCAVAFPRDTAEAGESLGIALILVAALAGAAGFVLGRQFRRRRTEDDR
jgi:uncharacterized protein HemX